MCNSYIKKSYCLSSKILLSHPYIENLIEPNKLSYDKKYFLFDEKKKFFGKQDFLLKNVSVEIILDQQQFFV